MKIDRQIDEQVDELVFSAIKLFDQAEALLSNRYETAKRQGDTENQQYALQKLAFLYTLRKDYFSAQKAYLRWENESSEPSFAKSENAFFLFNLARDSEKALEKIKEIEADVEPRIGRKLASEGEIRSLFRALHLKGRSLLKKGRLAEAEDTLRRINRLVQENPNVQFGFELDFIEEGLDAGLVADDCRSYLRNVRWSSYDSDMFEPRKEEVLKRLDLLRD